MQSITFLPVVLNRSSTSASRSVKCSLDERDYNTKQLFLTDFPKLEMDTNYHTMVVMALLLVAHKSYSVFTSFETCRSEAFVCCGSIFLVALLGDVYIISALEFAFNATKRGGTTVTAALPNPEARLKLSPVTLVGQEKTIKGSYLGGCIPSIDIPAYIELYKSGRLQVEKLISHRIKLSEVNQAFDRLASGEGIRQIIIFD